MKHIPTIPRIGAFDKQAVQCRHFFQPMPLVRGDISILLSFHVPLYPWPVKAEARFVTARTSDGQLRWIRRRIADD